MNLRLSLFSLCIASLMHASIHAQFSDGMLDTSFDGDGIAQVNFVAANIDNARAVAIQADGKVIVAGSSVVSGQSQVALARLTTSGALDGSFGTGGRVLSAVSPSGAAALAIALQPDGKIVIAGYAYTSSFDFMVLRYTGAGVLDGTFGSGGITTIPVSGDNDFASAIALQSDGKILIAGFAGIAGGNDFAVARLTDAGVLDSTFSGDGIATINMSSSSDQATAVAVQSDGKVVLAGLAYPSGNADFALARLTNTGVLDTTFGTAGKVITSLVAGADYANAMVIQPTGEILAAGQAANGGNDDFALVRYTTTGVLDTSFGTGGIVLTPIGTGPDVCRGVALQSDAKIIAAGSSSPGSFATVRYTGTGALDTSFGGSGKVTTAFGVGSAAGTALALHSSGRIVVAGDSVSSAGGTDFGVITFRVPQPDIAVAAGSALNDGTGTVDLGAAIAGQDGAPVTFTITNPGTAQLNNLAITKGGTDSADFDVSALSATSLSAGGGSVTFSVTFSPESGGVKTATLQIASNVSGTKNPFDISLSATALTTAQDTDNDGLNDVAEFQMAALGFNWQVAQNALVDTYFATANGAGLFTSSQVGSLKMPTPVIGRNPGNGLYTLQIGVEKSTSPPGSYEPFPISAPQTTIRDGKLELQFTSPDDAAFFRILPQ